MGSPVLLGLLVGIIWDFLVGDSVFCFGLAGPGFARFGYRFSPAPTFQPAAPPFISSTTVSTKKTLDGSSSAVVDLFLAVWLLFWVLGFCG